MFHLNQEYSDYVDMSDKDNYPNGCAIDATTDEGVDGTPYTARWRNNIQGAMEALWYAAFGTHSGITKKPDTVFDSDILRSLLRLIDNAIGNMVQQVSITGYETVVSWNTLGINYDEQKKYAVLALLGEQYTGFLPLQAVAKGDGVHIYATYISEETGKVVKGTRLVCWGEKNWGAYNWGENVAMAANIIIREVS